MAAPCGMQSPYLTESAVKASLREEPFRFDFFQAVRIVKQFPSDQNPGETGPRSDRLTFRSHPSTVFPASQIQSLEAGSGRPSTMTVNFMGLTGPSGVLPLPYSEIAIESVGAGNSATIDFLDIFNNRIIALFYEAWEKNHPFVRPESGGVDTVAEILLDLIGLGTSELRSRANVPHELFAAYAGLLLPRPRSAASLRQLVADYFNVPVDIEQFVGAWYGIASDRQFRLEEVSATQNQLGAGAGLGDEVWSQQMRVRIRLGPLTMGEYVQFLPGSSAYETLGQIVRYIANPELEFELQLTLNREEVPACELGSSGETSPRLGWTSWIKEKPLQRDPEETVLYLG